MASHEPTLNPNPWDTQQQTHFSKLKHTELSPLPGLWFRVYPGTRNWIRSDSTPRTFGSTLPTYKTFIRSDSTPWLLVRLYPVTGNSTPGFLLHQVWLISGTIIPCFQIFSLWGKWKLTTIPHSFWSQHCLVSHLSNVKLSSTFSWDSFYSVVAKNCPHSLEMSESWPLCCVASLLIWMQA